MVSPLAKVGRGRACSTKPVWLALHSASAFLPQRAGLGVAGRGGEARRGGAADTALLSWPSSPAVFGRGLEALGAWGAGGVGRSRATLPPLGPLPGRPPSRPQGGTHSVMFHKRLQSEQRPSARCEKAQRVYPLHASKTETRTQPLQLHRE